MDTKQRMHGQELYRWNDSDLMSEQQKCMDHVYDFNQTRPSDPQKQQGLLRQIFASIGEDCHIEPPLHASWGCHTHLGHRVYANFNLTLIDDTHIYIGNDVQFGPNVTISTAGHPIDPQFRKDGYQFNLPIHIEDNVWIGANTVLLPGVRVGENSVIGAGSVVSRDIEENVVAVGQPCRPIRPIGARDKVFFHGERRIDLPD